MYKFLVIMHPLILRRLAIITNVKNFDHHRDGVEAAWTKRRLGGKGYSKAKSNYH